MNVSVLIRHTTTFELGIVLTTDFCGWATGPTFCDVMWDDGMITTHPARDLTTDLELPAWLSERFGKERRCGS